MDCCGAFIMKLRRVCHRCVNENHIILRCKGPPNAQRNEVRIWKYITYKYGKWQCSVNDGQHIQVQAAHDFAGWFMSRPRLGESIIRNCCYFYWLASRWCLPQGLLHHLSKTRMRLKYLLEPFGLYTEILFAMAFFVVDSFHIVDYCKNENAVVGPFGTTHRTFEADIVFWFRSRACFLASLFLRWGLFWTPLQSWNVKKGCSVFSQRNWYFDGIWDWLVLELGKARIAVMYVTKQRWAGPCRLQSVSDTHIIYGPENPCLWVLIRADHAQWARAWSSPPLNLWGCLGVGCWVLHVIWAIQRSVSSGSPSVVAVSTCDRWLACP